MKKILVTAVAMAFTAAVSLTAYAHHSFAMFDDEVFTVLTGTVKDFQYTNPHSWLNVNVENEDGTITEWGFELDSPQLLRRKGVSPRHFVEGDQIAVKFHPLRDGRPAGWLRGAVTGQGNVFGNTEGLEVD